MSAPASGRRSRRSLAISLFLLVALAVTAVLLRRPLIAWFTGGTAGRAGTQTTVRTGAFSIDAALDPDPPRTKDNTLLLELRDSSGQPVDDAELGVVFQMPAMGTMPEMKGKADIAHEKDGRYRATFDLPMGGTWSLVVDVRAPSGSASQTFGLTVGTKGLATHGGAPPTPSTEAPPMVAIAYPPPALDTLRAAMDRVERVRALLAKDTLEGVPEQAHSIAEAFRAALTELPKDRADLADRFSGVTSAADRLALASSLDEARRSFAELNRNMVPLLGADARLTTGWHVFECPMFDRARWIQRREAPENPYMGPKMIACANASTWQAPARDARTRPSSDGEIDHYTCPMHPSVKQPNPGRCPLCGMDLVAVTKEQQEQGLVMIDEARRQLIGVRTARVLDGPMRDTFRAVGVVAYDESALTDVNLKVRGWITRLAVSKTGQRVTHGQTLFSMYSPELYNAQQDYVLATRATSASARTESDGGAASPSRGDALGRAARQRLLLLGMSEAQLEALSKKGEPMENVAVPSPASGFVIEKNVVDGAAVEAGARLYRIAALDKVWIEAEVYESDLTRVRVGHPATVTLDYVPGRTYEAKVSYVYPYIDPKARTGRVRIELANKELDLRPGMFASVSLASDLGRRIQVPLSAVVYTGPRRLVFVDLGGGRFKPQEIQVGATADGMYEVLSGLAPGDIVATSGVFLIAAEARISTAVKYWESGGAAREDAGASREGSSSPPVPDPTEAPPTTTRQTSPGSAPPGRSDGVRPSVSPSGGASTVDAGPRTPTVPSDPRPPPAAATYSCPMHPEVTREQPGKCPSCGMDLRPKEPKP